MILRKYQQDCTEDITRDLEIPGASVCVLPTGAGKSHIIAAAALLKHPVLILCPSRELLSQNMAKLALLVPESDIGVYSASFGRKDIRTFTFATIQSIYRKPELFQDAKLVIVDECHQLSPRNLEGMLSSFLNGLPNAKVLGLTATPFRAETVYETSVKYVNGKKEVELFAATGIKMINRIKSKKTKENMSEKIFWRRILYNISHNSLVSQGYLVPLEYIHEPLLPYESLPINISYSDFDLSSYSQMVIGMESQILRTIGEAQRRYKSVLIFCAETGQAKRLSEIVKGSAYVLGDSDKKTRTRTIDDFKSGKLQTVFNVGCLTVGFDKPDLDCIILLRPVRSPILYLQMLGRLTRPAEGKTHGTVIDLTGSCKALGPIESFEVFRNNGLWDVRTSKVDSFHGKILFRQKIQK